MHRYPPLSLSHLCHEDGKIPIHRSAYRKIERHTKEWCTKKEGLFNGLEVLRDSMGEFLLTFLSIHILRAQLLSYSEEEILDIHRVYKEQVTAVIDISTWEPDEQWFLQTFFQNPLLLGDISSTELSRSRCCLLLELPTTVPEIDEIEDYLQKRRVQLQKQKKRSLLEEEILLLLRSEVHTHELLFLLLGKEERLDAPQGLKNISQAQSLLSCWNAIHEKKQEVQILEQGLSLINIDHRWSYGSQEEYCILVCIHPKDITRPHYAWGDRKVIPFGLQSEAYQFLLDEKPQRAFLTMGTLSFPHADQFAKHLLREGCNVDCLALFGRDTQEAISLIAGLRVKNGQILYEKELLEEEEQERARKELENLLLDFDDEG